jgi:hypothetical protein
MNAWEYLIVGLPPFEPARDTKGHSAAVEVLNREGADGWEAVGLSNLADGAVAVLLKRRSSDDLESRRGSPAQRSTGS